MAVAMGNCLIDKLQQLGLAPPNVRRLVIDVSMNQLVAVYYECFGDPRTLAILTPEALDGAVVLSVEDLADK